MAQDMHGERGATTIEFATLAAVVAALMVAFAAHLPGAGSSVAGAVGTRILAAASGEGDPRRVRREAGEAPHAPAGSGPFAHVSAALRGRVRSADEKRAGGGSLPARVSRDDLRLSPIVPPAAWRERRERAQGEAGGVRWRGEAEGCAICGSVGWRHDVQRGAGIDGGGAEPGLSVDVPFNARAALLALDVGGRVERSLGWGSLSAQGRAQAMAGAELDGRASLHVGPQQQRVELRGGAMAGAVARAEASGGVQLLGVAIEQSGRAEGWAGAGARGIVDVRREQHRLAWRVGWGAALGLGGAAEWGGSVDVSAMPPKRRRAAARLLVHALRSTTPLPPGPLPLLLHTRRNDG